MRAVGIIQIAMTHYFRFPALFCILSSTVMANGLLIYKEQGFHSDQQAKLAEYVTADVIPQMVTVTLKSGNKLDVPAGKSPVVIPLAKDSTDEPKTILKRIDTSIARFPQFKTQLERIKSDWIAKMPVPTDARFADGTLPSSSTPNTPIPENAFRDGVVTNVYPDGVTVSSSSSIAKVRFADMTPEEKARFNYDPVKEKEYLDGLERERKASIERKRISDEQEAREATVRHKEYLKSVVANTVTIEEVESDLPRFIDVNITIQGELSLGSYYNWAFDGLETDLLCFSVRDDSGRGYLYVKRGANADALRKLVLSRKEPIKGRFTFVIPRALYRSGQAQVLGLLIDMDKAVIVNE